MGHLHKEKIHMQKNWGKEGGGRLLEGGIFSGTYGTIFHAIDDFKCQLSVLLPDGKTCDK